MKLHDKQLILYICIRAFDLYDWCVERLVLSTLQEPTNWKPDH